jgi:hypothetical protein
MKLNCLSCGHKVDLDDAYDDYEGQVKCLACGAILDIKTDQGKIKKIKYDSSLFHPGARARRAVGAPAS